MRHERQPVPVSVFVVATWRRVDEPSAGYEMAARVPTVYRPGSCSATFRDVVLQAPLTARADMEVGQRWRVEFVLLPTVDDVPRTEVILGPFKITE